MKYFKEYYRLLKYTVNEQLTCIKVLVISMNCKSHNISIRDRDISGHYYGILGALLRHFKEHYCGIFSGIIAAF